MQSYPDALLRREARDRFLSANRFQIQDCTAPTFTVKICGVALKLPNTEARKRAVPIHDLHHVLTGYRPDWIGEAEIGAWEIRTGCASLTVYGLNGSAVAFGLFISPARVWCAPKSAKGQRALCRDPAPYDALLEMTVGELRKRLGIQPRGPAALILT